MEHEDDEHRKRNSILRAGRSSVREEVDNNRKRFPNG